jgi:hypothetical protein
VTVLVPGHRIVEPVFFTRVAGEDADTNSMRSLIFFLLTVVSSQLVQAQIPRSSFYFNYATRDGSTNLDCGFSPLADQPEVYKVICGKGTALYRIFEIRFRVRPVGSQMKTAYEVVYWISESNKLDKWIEGSTAWITLNKGAMSELALHQQVENGQAALIIHYSAGL